MLTVFGKGEVARDHGRPPARTNQHSQDQNPVRSKKRASHIEADDPERDNTPGRPLQATDVA